MKTIGIIGGMSFESTITYYKTINETINNQLGNLNSAKILLYSVNFEEIANLQKNGEWEKAAQILGECAKKLVELILYLLPPTPCIKFLIKFKKI